MQQDAIDAINRNTLALIEDDHKSKRSVLERNTDQAVEKEQMLQCVNFLRIQMTPIIVEGKSRRPHMTEIAQQMGIHLSTLYDRLKIWRDSGILQDATTTLHDELVLNYQGALRGLASRFGDVVEDQLETALTAEKPVDRSRAAVFVRDLLGEFLEEAGSEIIGERDKLPDPAGFNPLATVKSIQVTIQQAAPNAPEQPTNDYIEGEVIQS